MFRMLKDPAEDRWFQYWYFYMRRYVCAGILLRRDFTEDRPVLVESGYCLDSLVESRGLS